MDRKLGLNGYFQIVKGAGLKFKIKELYWQLRYAWQRAWRGYDNIDVFDLGPTFVKKMPVLLREFKKYNDSLFCDLETQRTLTEEETNQVLDEMIFYFENCDEYTVYDRVLGGKGLFDVSKEERDKAYAEAERCQKEAIRLFSKWCWHLWY